MSGARGVRIDAGGTGRDNTGRNDADCNGIQGSTDRTGRGGTR